jgi:hypothetical protein
MVEKLQNGVFVGYAIAGVSHLTIQEIVYLANVLAVIKL